MFGCLVASLPLQPRTAVKQVLTKTHARTFFLLDLLKGGNAQGKGVGGLQSVVRGIGQKKKAFAVGGGFGE
jgi:hypothetical protein